VSADNQTKEAIIEKEEEEEDVGELMKELARIKHEND